MPLTDYPEHLLMMQILGHYEDSTLNYTEHYVPDLRNNPNVTVYVGSNWLHSFFAIETIGKIFLTCYVALLPIALIYFVASFAPNKIWISLLSIPLCFNLFFFIGMLNFLVSIPLVFFLIAALYRNLTYGVSPARCLMLIILGVLLFYSHLSSFLGFLMAGSLVMFALRRYRRPFWINLLCLLPSLGVFIVWYWHRRLALGHYDALGWDPLQFRLLYLLQPLMVYWDDQHRKLVSDPIYLVLTAGVLVLSVFAIFHRNKKKDSPTRRHGSILALALFLLFCAATILIPSTASGVTLSHRYSLYAVLCALPLLPEKMVRTPKHKVFLCFLCGLILGSVYVRVVRFNREMKTVEHMIEHMDYRSNVLPLLFSWHGAGLKTYPYLHIMCYYHMAKGGMSPYLFSHTLPDTKIYPVRMKKQSSFGPGEWTPGAFDWSHHSQGFRYFVVKGYNKNALAQLFSHARLVFQENDWLIFEQ
jgi:MFS family permease